MGMTMIEKILAHHSTYDVVRPGEIINLFMDLRVLRDLGGVNIIKQLKESKLSVSEPARTFFTFDFYPPFPDPVIAENQQACRVFSRENGIKFFDIHSGIGSHLLIDNGLVTPGSICASSETHSNILGAIGALGCGLNEKDMLSAISKGKIWYRVPKSLKINITGQLPEKTSAKDIGLALLSIFRSNKLLGYSVEFTGDVIDMLSLDGRITLASMANEMGALTFLFQPNQEVIDYCTYKSNQTLNIFLPDEDAEYDDVLNIDLSRTNNMIALPGDGEIVPLQKIAKTGIDSAFIGTCTNGRIEDLRIAAGVLKNRKVAPGVILKIVPSTDEIWTLALQEGLIDIFKEAGAMVSNAGCGGCSSGQFSHAGLGNVTISTGNKNFAGRNGRGDVYLAAPAIVAASSVAGYITSPDLIPEKSHSLLSFPGNNIPFPATSKPGKNELLEGKAWHIPFNDIDTDMIYNSRYKEITDISQLGNYTFSQLTGYENFASEVSPGDIIITGKNFGLGSTTRHAIDCFKSLGIQAIIAKSFAVIYEHNAITAGLPVVVCSKIDQLEIQSGDTIQINIETGEIINSRNNHAVKGEKFSGIRFTNVTEKIS